MSTIWKVLIVVALLVALLSVWWQYSTRKWMVDEMIPRTVFKEIGGPPDPNTPPPPPPQF